MLTATLGCREGFVKKGSNLGLKGSVRSEQAEGKGQTYVSLMCQVENEVRRSGQRGGPFREAEGNEAGTRKEAH